MGGREAGFAVFLGAAAFAATALTPSSAEACACCGSAESTYVKAWSRDGKRVLLHTNIEATCNRQEYYEVWKIGDGEREYCLDAYAEDPTEHVDCDRIEGVDPNGAIVPDPADLQLPAEFEDGASTLREDDLLVWGAPTFDYDNTVEGETFRLEIRAYAKSGFAEVDTLDFEPSGYSALVDAVSLWPAPRGRDAVLLVRSGSGTDDEIIDLVWVELPRRFERGPAAKEPVWAAPRHRPMPPDPDRDPSKRASAARILARARVYERIGDHAEAKLLAEAAVSVEPAFMRPWIELARLMAMVGQPHQAVAVLSRVDALPCKDCRAELRTALPNRSFDSIRDTPAFRRLGAKP